MTSASSPPPAPASSDFYSTPASAPASSQREGLAAATTAKERPDPFGFTVPAEGAAANAERPRPRRDTSPLRIQHYELIRPLGRGGMGSVVLARDTRLGRLVAIKFLETQRGDATSRFLIEARATAKISHENIVVIHELGEHEGKPYMVLEYLKGKTLRDVLVEQKERLAETDSMRLAEGWSPEEVQGGLPPDRAVELVLPVVRALVCAHQHGIVHRDLKPANILVTDTGAVKVLDFGIAKLLGTQETKALGESTSESGGEWRAGTNALTMDGALVGTMPYMSPEQWGVGEVDAQTDIWAVGVILAELVLGEHPLGQLNMLVLADVSDLELPMPSMTAQRVRFGKLASIIDRCLKKKKEERLGSAEELLRELEALRETRRRTATEEEQPYVGLSAFRESDAERYFGRGRATTEVVTRLADQPLIAIVGPSGAGKSSFVRAGVLPALGRGGEAWESLVMRPGAQPLVALAELLLGPTLQASRITTLSEGDELGAESVQDREGIAARLREEPGYLGTQLRAWARRKGTRVLLLVDQLEEVYTMAPLGDRAAFFACIAGAADDAGSPLRVVLTLRADFLDRVTEAHAAMIGLSRGIWLLPPMDREGLREALVRPLLDVGYQFEPPTLVEEMLEELSHTSGALPLLSFTASKLWELRDTTLRALTEESYRSLGGIAGTLARHADSVLRAMSAEERKICRAVFLRLVTPERARASCTLGELRELSSERAECERVLSRLIDARLLTVTGGDEEDATVEVVHEALISAWPALARWLEANHVDAAIVARVRHAAREWEASGQSEDLLWRGQRADETERWYGGYSGELSPSEKRYVEAMIEQAGRQRTRRRRLTGGAIGLLAAVAIVVSWLGIRASDAAAEARGQAVRAQEEASRADLASAKAQAEARRARNTSRMLGARVEEGDPTMALALLREVESPDLPVGWEEATRAAMLRGVARGVIPQPAWVLALAWSPDDKLLATAAMDKKVRIWRAEGQGGAKALTGHENNVLSVEWSADGKALLTASSDKTARVWDVESGLATLVLRGHEGAVRQAAWSPNGESIATASADGTARVWSARGGNELRVFRGHEGAVEAVSWSPDGKSIVTGSADRTARVWRVESEGTPLVLRGHEDLVQSVAFSPDGQQVATASGDKTARVWNASGEGSPILFREHEGSVQSARWSADGKRVVTASSDGTARVWYVDGQGPTLVYRQSSRGNELSAAEWSHDGKSIATASSSDVRVWSADLASQRVQLRGHEKLVFSVAWSPDGKRLASMSEDGTARVWKTDEWREAAVLRGHAARVTGGAWSPDSKRLVTVSWDGTARVWEPESRAEPLFVFKDHTDKVYESAFSPDGRRIATASLDDTVRVFQADGTGEPLVLRGSGRGFLSVAFSPDGRRIAAAALEGTVFLWSADGKGEPVVLRGHEERVHGVAWSPDGARLATASWDETVRIWNADGSGSPLVLLGHTTWVYSVSWTPDGAHLVTASQDNTVRIWKADWTGQPSVVLVSGQPFNRAALSPDGRTIAAASDDHTIWVTQEISPLRGPLDQKLWGATSYCPSAEQRMKQFTILEAAALDEVDACLRRIRAAQLP